MIMRKLLLMLAAGLIMVSCDILDTRDPEDPEAGRSSFNSATTPNVLFSNMVSAFSDRLVENYNACFADPLFIENNFRFIPSAGAVSKYPVLNDWDIEAEKEYFRQLIGSVTTDMPIVLNFFDEEVTQLGDSAVYRYNYTITINSSDESLVTDFAGTGEFKIKRDNRSIWVITEWTDIRKDENPSWSELKGLYY